MVKTLLHVEGLVFFIVSLYLYQQLDGSWIVFFLLLFIPDISMLGYLKNKKIGAIFYNLGHNYTLALITIFLGYILFKDTVTTLLGIILFAHISLDRFLGYGLKYPTNFKDTHLQKV